MVYLLIGTVFGFALAWALRGRLDRRTNGSTGDVCSATSGGAGDNDATIAEAVETNEAAGNAIEGIQNLINGVRRSNSRDSSL